MVNADDWRSPTSCDTRSALFDAGVQGPAWLTPRRGADAANEIDGRIDVKASYLGREPEILLRLQETATVFFFPLPVSLTTGNYDRQNLDLSTSPPSLKNLADVDWYRTLIMVADVKVISELTAADVVRDWLCDNATGAHSIVRTRERVCSTTTMAVWL